MKDVAFATLRAARARQQSGVFNIGNGTPVSINELIGPMERAAGSRLAVQYGPRREGDVRDSMADIRARWALAFEPTVSLTTGLAE